jgi:hypothetical protein
VAAAEEESRWGDGGGGPAGTLGRRRAGGDGRRGRELGFRVAARGWGYKAWVGVVGGFFCKII